MTDRALARVYSPPEKAEPDRHANYVRFVAHLKKRRAEGRPINIVIDGRETSVGKSTVAATLAAELDVDYRRALAATRSDDPSIGRALEKVVYSAQAMQAGFARTEPSMFVYDDVTGILGNRGARDAELQGLISSLSIVRKNGHGVMLLAPKKELFDGPILNSLANFWVFATERGSADVYRAWMGARHRRSQSKYPFDSWNRVTPIGWESLDGTPFFDAYEARAIESNREFFRLRALDPTGRVRQCPRCQKLGSAYQIAVHACPGGAAASENNSTPVGGAPQRTGASRPPPPPRPELRCGALVFTRADVYHRHLTTATHREGRCGSFTPTRPARVVA